VTFAAVMRPSVIGEAPVIFLASSDATRRVAFAGSSARAWRPLGMCTDRRELAIPLPLPVIRALPSKRMRTLRQPTAAAYGTARNVEGIQRGLRGAVVVRRYCEPRELHRTLARFPTKHLKVFWNGALFVSDDLRPAGDSSRWVATRPRLDSGHA
jgi:hypothetical protein